MENPSRGSLMTEKYLHGPESPLLHLGSSLSHIRALCLHLLHPADHATKDTFLPPVPHPSHGTELEALSSVCHQYTHHKTLITSTATFT